MAKAFFLKFHAFSLKDSGDVKLVELFIDVVDTHLLVVIKLEVLKTKNVQKTDCLGLILERVLSPVGRLNRLVHHNNEPIKHVVKQLLGDGIFVIVGLLLRNRNPLVSLALHSEPLMHKNLLEMVFVLASQKITNLVANLRIFELAWLWL